MVILRRTTSALALPLTVLAPPVSSTSSSRSVERSAGASAGLAARPVPVGQAVPSVTPADFDMVHWPAVAVQVTNVATIGLMSTVALLLNASGLGWQPVVKSILIANCRLRGRLHRLWSGGRSRRYQQLSLSAMNQQVRGGRLAPLVAAAMCAVVLFFGGTVLSLFPRSCWAVSCSSWASLVIDWVIRTWSILPRTDYAIIMLILLVTATLASWKRWAWAS